MNAQINSTTYFYISKSTNLHARTNVVFRIESKRHIKMNLALELKETELLYV